MKILFILLAACAIATVHAEMYYDPYSSTSFTYPETKNINKAEYNTYVEELDELLRGLCETKEFTPIFVWRYACVTMHKRASKANTPTSRQFIADLELIPSIYDFQEIMGLNR